MGRVVRKEGDIIDPCRILSEPQEELATSQQGSAQFYLAFHQPLPTCREGLGQKVGAIRRPPTCRGRVAVVCTGVVAMEVGGG